jgi:two-component system OmpR family sensor kinase
VKRSWLPWILAVTPLLLALAAGLWIQTRYHPLPLLVVRADPGTWLYVIGGLISALALLYLAGSQRMRWRSRKFIEEERAAADDARRRFLRRLDHELKNPLTALRAALANLSAEITTSDGERTAQDAQRLVERLSRLVADLRKLSDLEERPIEQLPVDLGELLEEVVEAASNHPAYSRRKVSLVVAQVPWRLPPVIGDRDLLSLAFYNLLDNALKFTRADDAIEVRALEDGHSLLVEVADTGPGIHPDDQPRIFEELYRGANAGGSEGSGLGLALVQRIVTRHGGSVAVRSRATGEGGGGTVFSVRLPQA